LGFCAAFVAAGCAQHTLDAAPFDAGAGTVAAGDAAAGVNTMVGPAPSPDAAADASMTGSPDASSDAGNPGVCVPPVSPSWRLVAPV